MDWYELKVTVHRESEDAVAEFLRSLGISGVSVEDASLFAEAVTRGWADIVDPVEPSDVVVLRAYVLPAKAEPCKDALSQFVASLPSFGLARGPGLVETTLVSETDWAEAWKEHFHVLHIARVVIQPSWRPYTPQGDEVVVTLDPGMAFGTGTHPSTAMCIELLQRYVQPGFRVHDVGTGSGILAVTAAKLGAASVQAVDIDPVSVSTAAGNAERNGVTVAVSPGTIEALQDKADIIVANIIADVIVDLLPFVRPKLTLGGLFLASGIISRRSEDVQRAASEQGFVCLDALTSAEWTAQVFMREEDAACRGFS